MYEVTIKFSFLVDEYDLPVKNRTVKNLKAFFEKHPENYIEDANVDLDTIEVLRIEFKGLEDPEDSEDSAS